MADTDLTIHPSQRAVVLGESMRGTGLERVWSFLVRTAVPLTLTLLAVGAAPVVAAIPLHPNGGTWSVVARCESGGNWNIGTGIAYEAGPRFSPVAEPARAASPDRAPDGATAPRTGLVHAQVLVAEQVLRSQGIGAWPRCSSAVPWDGVRADRAGLAGPPMR